jgi:diguanylate cyclase (GGDEF)-like protein
MMIVARAPVDARQRVISIAAIVALVAATAGLLPFAARPLPAAPGAVPLLLGIAVASQLVTAYLLFNQFLASRVLRTALLGSAYTVGGLSMLAYVIAFPGVSGNVFAPQVAPWSWLAWHVEFPVAVSAAFLLGRAKRVADAPGTAPRWVWAMLAVATVTAIVPAIALTMRGSHLPVIVRAGDYAPTLGASAVDELLLFVNVLALALAVFFTRARTMLDLWLIVALAAACLDVLISLAGGARFAVGWYFGRILGVVSSTALLVAYLQQLNAIISRLSDLSMVDGLTGLANRRSFEGRLQDAVRVAHRTNRPLAFLLADVDRFKDFNDSYGHLAGDEALKIVASSLRAPAMRPADLVARWGGEEFVALLPDTDRAGAHLVAERLRAAVAALAIPQRRSGASAGVLTISIGVATLGARGDDPGALMARADAALYRAKSNGRNTVAAEVSPV